MNSKYITPVSKGFSKEGAKNDCSDNLCIGYTGNDEKYYQFDSYEGFHAASFFEKEFHLHGLKVTSKEINIPEEILRKYEVN